jgi:hypothetical protein
MPHCQVEETGSGGRVERLGLEAASVLEAGYQAIERLARMWWRGHAKPVTVRLSSSLWRVGPGPDKRMEADEGSVRDDERILGHHGAFSTLTAVKLMNMWISV